jgi:hypothetical protein
LNERHQQLLALDQLDVPVRRHDEEVDEDVEAVRAEVARATWKSSFRVVEWVRTVSWMPSTKASIFSEGVSHVIGIVGRIGNSGGIFATRP